MSSESKADRARRRRAELVGDLIPDTSSDETDEGWSEKDEGGTRDDELRRDVPPHHG